MQQWNLYSFGAKTEFEINFDKFQIWIWFFFIYDSRHFEQWSAIWMCSMVKRVETFTKIITVLESNLIKQEKYYVPKKFYLKIRLTCNKTQRVDILLFVKNKKKCTFILCVEKMNSFKINRIKWMTAMVGFKSITKSYLIFDIKKCSLYEESSSCHVLWSFSRDLILMTKLYFTLSGGILKLIFSF